MVRRMRSVLSCPLSARLENGPFCASTLSLVTTMAVLGWACACAFFLATASRARSANDFWLEFSSVGRMACGGAGGGTVLGGCWPAAYTPKAIAARMERFHCMVLRSIAQAQRRGE